MKVQKFIDAFKQMHPAKKAYVFMWALFLILLIVWIAFTAYNSANPIPSDLNETEIATMQAARADANAGIALGMAIALFAAVIQTVLTHTFFLKGKKLFNYKKQGGFK